MATRNTIGAGDILMNSDEFGDCQEEDLDLGCSNAGDTAFDEVIGHIEDIIMDEEFQNMQEEFMEKYYEEFEDTEENKFVYTDIHKEYISLVEKFLEKELSQRMDQFDMEAFQAQIMERKDELDGEVFEILMTFSDFVAFKEMFVDYKKSKDGDVVDLSDGFTVTALGSATNLPAPAHSNTYDFGIQGTSLSQANPQGSSGSSQQSLPGPQFGLQGASILTPLPSREPDMSRLASRAQDEPMMMSPGASVETSQ